MAGSLEITLGKIRLRANLEGSRFIEVYDRLLQHHQLTRPDQVFILTMAALFLRSADDAVNRLGYKIVLQYSLVTGDLEPLFDVARTKEYMPVVAGLETLQPSLFDESSMAQLFFQAHRTNFGVGMPDGQTTFRTRGQMEIRAFSAMHRDAVIVAPTSYGKSEMLIDKVRENTSHAICVLVPTRALIAQTRRLLIGDEGIRASKVRVITHPDSYTGLPNFVAVMTQERLQRLFQLNPGLALDMILVDEAHNLLPNDSRAREASQVLMTAEHRNPEVGISYFTPFLANTDSVSQVNQQNKHSGKNISEYVKIERVVHADLSTRSLRQYDQFLNRFVTMPESIPDDELGALSQLAGQKNLIYVNRPRDAQHLAQRLSNAATAEVSPRAETAIKAIAELIDPSYGLIDCIRSGVLFHHGKVPDLLRQYIEDLFRNEPSISKLVTTSTLLEGVNTPADRLFILTPKKGPAYLSGSAFKNLIGRVGRFSEVFSQNSVRLDLLQPLVYLMKSSYSPANWAVEKFISRVSDARREITDEVLNPLLEKSPLISERADALEFIENIEPGSTGLEAPTMATTKVGQLCFKNGVRDFDIFESEAEIQRRVDLRSQDANAIGDVGDVIAAICELFLYGIPLDESSELLRVRDNEGAQAFYSMFLDWRANNEPYKRMVGNFLRYWSRLNDELVYVGSAWGEETYGDGFRLLYVRMANKTRSQRINLAVAKVKEEQDFVDFNLMRYIEIMNDLSLLTATLYNRLKYGTDDPHEICLLRNGMSPELVRLVRSKYRNHVVIDLDINDVTVHESLIPQMRDEDENDILIYEAETLAIL